MTTKLRKILRILIVAGIGLHGTNAAADNLRFEVSGIDEPLSTNVLNQVASFKVGRRVRLSQQDAELVQAEAMNKARQAVRPYGYYHAEVAAQIEAIGDEDWVLKLDVRRGAPTLVQAADIAVIGDGERLGTLTQWRSKWPLGAGKILDQTVWENQKQRALALARADGYLGANFEQQSIALNLQEKTAHLTLTLNTGPRFLMGEIDYGDHVLKPGILESIPRFENGHPYRLKLIDQFRLDLWKTGYFTNVEVEEIRLPQTMPPTVNLRLKLATDTRNSYQGSIGIGTDSGFRTQAQWSRHPMSSNGDRIDVGAGWQEADEEFSLRGTYRLPRRKNKREYWVSDLVLRFENLDLNVKRDRNDEGFVQIANGNVEERHLRFGRLKLRNLKSGEKQFFETLFAQYLSGSRKFSPLTDVVPTLGDPNSSAAANGLLVGTDNALSIGADWDMAFVRGKGFSTEGHRERAWVFHSNSAFGSEVEFTQIYLSSKRSYLKGENWKFLLRAEIGYTDARVDNFNLDVNGETLPFSVTRLPNYYRFRTGGGASVRGYGFEDLSDNRIGSNNVVSASIETEYRFRNNWSVAAFADIGNAFNDWDTPRLLTGLGIGVRWYSIAGPIRIDLAQAIDLDDKPWRVHFTIGTPLL